MMDALTRKPIQLKIEGDAYPYFRIDVDQIPRIRDLFDRHGVHYWINSNAISFDGQPALTVVNLSRRNDPQWVQSILDRVN